MSHKNNGDCEQCNSILSAYPGMNETLKTWFKQKQKDTPTFHCCDAGRGRAEQETYFARKASNAHYGESAHNYNCAIDTFFQINGQYHVDKNLYLSIVSDLPNTILWYGRPPAPFMENPHFEIVGWKALAAEGTVKLVEP